MRRQSRRILQGPATRSEEHTSELQSQSNLVCRLLLEKKNKTVAIPSSLPPLAVTPHTAVSSHGNMPSDQSTHSLGDTFTAAVMHSSPRASVRSCVDAT